MSLVTTTRAFPITVERTARYSDLDPTRRLGRDALLRWFEDARVTVERDAFDSDLTTREHWQVKRLLAGVRVDVLAPLKVTGRPYEVGLGVTRIIAQRLRHGSRPRQELVVGAGIASDVFFRDAVGAHGPPFIVVPFEPDFEQIGEPAVFGNVFGWKVAMIIEDRLRVRVLVIESSRDLVREQKIVVEEGHQKFATMTGNLPKKYISLGERWRLL